MRKFMIAASAAAAISASVTAGAVEVYKDYVPSKEVYTVTFVRVSPNRLDDYLEGLRQTWLGSCELQKKQGTVLDCAVYASETMANRDFNLLLVVSAPSAAVSDPDEKRYTQFMADLRQKLAEDQEKKLVQGYDQMRTFFGEQSFRRLTFK